MALHSRKTSICGITFDSKTEAEYYLYLLSCYQSGEITKPILQPHYELQPACKRYGKKYRKMEYIADFAYTERKTGQHIVVDVKGYAMEDAALKRKLFAYKYPELCLIWVAKSQKYSSTGWMEYDELMKVRRKTRRSGINGRV